MHGEPRHASSHSMIAGMLAYFSTDSGAVPHVRSPFLGLAGGFLISRFASAIADDGTDNERALPGLGIPALD